MAPDRLELVDVQEAGWDTQAIAMRRERPRLVVAVRGTIGNAITTSDCGRRTKETWRVTVARCVTQQRGSSPWDGECVCAVSLALRFCMSLHGNRRLDVENYVKPSLDALAAGLFCDSGTELEARDRWDFGDSVFRHLFIHRLNDAERPEDEGALFCVSVA